jgi:hypothetical protein
MNTEINARPEKTLLTAVLIRAAQDALDFEGKSITFRKNSPEFKKREVREAQNYFGLHDDRPNLRPLNKKQPYFTFAYVCEALSLCPVQVHRRMKRAMETKLKGALRNGKHMGFIRRIATATEYTYEDALSIFDRGEYGNG